MATKTEQKFDALDFTFEPREDYVKPTLGKKAAALRAEGQGWNEIAEELGSDRATVSLAAHVHNEGLINFRTQKELARAIQRARDAGEAWSKIGARAGGLTEGRVQALYEEATGEPYFKTYIEHGGRPRGDGLGFQGLDDGAPIINMDGEAKPKKKAKAKTEKAAPAKKAATKKTRAKKGSVSFGETPTEDEVKKALVGKTVTVARPGGKTADFEVEEILGIAQNKKGDWGTKVKTTAGKETTFALDKIQKVA